MTGVPNPVFFIRRDLTKASNCCPLVPEDEGGDWEAPLSNFIPSNKKTNIPLVELSRAHCTKSYRFRLFLSKISRDELSAP